MTSEIFPEMAEDAKKVMSIKQYKQEFEASFETAAGRIYEDYSTANHTSEVISEHEQLLWYHDFNYTPLSSGVGVKRGNDYYLLEEIVLVSAVALNSAQEFVERYKDHKNKRVIIYGDPAGKAGEKHSQASDYTDIEAELRSHGWTYERRVRSKAMSIKDSQNALRAKIKSADNVVSLFVNTANAPYTHKGLSTVQLKKGSTFMEVESDYQHITTAVRYMMDYEHPVNKPVAYMPIRFSI
jgi:lambda repressor-like predicted transcriptional regulator